MGPVGLLRTVFCLIVCGYFVLRFFELRLRGFYWPVVLAKLMTMLKKNANDDGGGVRKKTVALTHCRCD